MTVLKALLGDQSAEIMQSATKKKKPKSVQFREPLVEAQAAGATIPPPSYNGSVSSRSLSPPLSINATEGPPKQVQSPRRISMEAAAAMDACNNIMADHVFENEGPAALTQVSFPAPMDTSIFIESNQVVSPSSRDRKRRVSLEMESSPSSSSSSFQPHQPPAKVSRPNENATVIPSSVQEQVRQRESLENRTLLWRISPQVDTKMAVKTLQTTMHNEGLVYYEWPIDYWTRDSPTVLRLEFVNSCLAKRAMNLNGMPLQSGSGTCLCLERVPEFQGTPEGKNLWWQFQQSRKEWSDVDKQWIINEKEGRQVFLRNIPRGMNKDRNKMKRFLNNDLKRRGVSITDIPSIHSLKFLRGDPSVAILSFSMVEEAQAAQSLGEVEYMGTVMTLGPTSGSSPLNNYKDNIGSRTEEDIEGYWPPQKFHHQEDSSYYSAENEYSRDESLSYYGPASHAAAEDDTADEENEHSSPVPSKSPTGGITNRDLKEILNDVDASTIETENVATKTMTSAPNGDGSICLSKPSRFPKEIDQFQTEAMIAALEQKLAEAEREKLELQEELLDYQDREQRHADELESSRQYFLGQLTAKSKQLEESNKQKELLEKKSAEDKCLIKKQCVKLSKYKKQKLSLQARLGEVEDGGAVKDESQTVTQEDNRKLLSDLMNYQKELALTQRQLQLCQKQWSKAFQWTLDNSETVAVKQEGTASCDI
jgi:hypothetical protein